MPCPICDKPTDPTYRPFCCRRCADIDLGRWLTESYVVPTDEGPDEAAPDGAEAPRTERRRPH